jgi:protein-disulfide isomerase
MKMKFLLSLLMIFALAGCMSDAQFKEKLGKVIEQNPEIVLKVFEKKPVETVQAFQKAVTEARGELAKKAEQDEKSQMAGMYDKPLAPSITAADAVRGSRSAPIVLVEYSDFQCPFCTRGYNTVTELVKKYGDKIQFVYKHLPLSFHDKAMLAAQYFEAIKLQNNDKAFQFHDALFKDQQKVANGDPFFKSMAKQVGADMARLAKDLNSDAVKTKIQNDMQEAAKFEIQGTPGFVINGIPLKGAYPADQFVTIIEELVKRGKLKL